MKIKCKTSLQGIALVIEWNAKICVYSNVNTLGYSGITMVGVTPTAYVVDTLFGSGDCW